jgi:hypothetical protein
MGFEQPTAFSPHVVASTGGFFLAILQAPTPPGFPEAASDICLPLMISAALFGGFVVWIIDKRRRAG